MALQVDIIPATGTDYFTTNIEDGIALADGPFATTFAERLPGGVGADPGAPAIHGRGPGIELHPDVLPFSNIPA